MSDYIPLPGDLVQFPGAPLSVNRTRRYEIISVAGGLVTFRIGAQEFTKNLSQLQDIGMRKAGRWIEDPTWDGRSGENENASQLQSDGNRSLQSDGNRS